MSSKKYAMYKGQRKVTSKQVSSSHKMRMSSIFQAKVAKPPLKFGKR